jgi:hypothetical protein
MVHDVNKGLRNARSKDDVDPRGDYSNLDTVGRVMRQLIGLATR